MQNFTMIRKYKFILSFVLFFLLNNLSLSASGVPVKPIVAGYPETAQLATPMQESENTTGKAKRMERRKARVQKFLQSKFGQWLIKKSIQKAERKQYRQEKRALKGDKEALKVLKEKRKERFVMTSNLRLGLIFVIAGVIALIIGGSVFSTLGAIAMIIGLVFILLDLI